MSEEEYKAILHAYKAHCTSCLHVRGAMHCDENGPVSVCQVGNDLYDAWQRTKAIEGR